jgi:hypothetical protein
MDSQRFKELLALASRHLAEARQVITQQEQLIHDMLDRGADTSGAQSLLEKLKVSAGAMAEHERNIAQQLRELEQSDK